MVAEQKITPLQLVNNESLHIISKQLKLDHYKSITRTYRYLFITIGIVFCFLGVIAFMKPITAPILMLMGSQGAIKAVLCFLCFGLAASAFTLGICMRTEVEVCKNLTNSAKTKLRRELTKKKLKQGLKGSFYWGKRGRVLDQLQSEYDLSFHHMDDHKEEALYQLKHMRQNIGFDQSLRNQHVEETLLKLHKKLEQEFNTYISG